CLAFPGNFKAIATLPGRKSWPFLALLVREEHHQTAFAFLPFHATEHLLFTEIVTKEIRVELVGPEEEARWNKLVRKHHCLKEHRMVGESLRYVAKQNGRWIALLGWSSAAFHLRPRDAWIGWSDAQRNAGRHLMACNAR